MYMTAPAENLSSKLYIPKTNPPVFVFVPITSEMKLIPVAKTIVCEQPMNAASMYMTQLVDSEIKYIDPKERKQMIVPMNKACFLPNN